MAEKFRFRKPFLYKLLYLYAGFMHRLYYRRITVIGIEKIPADTPVIFAPNHQNALMDALAVLYSARKPVAFMARADIFKKPTMAKLLKFLRILPIYRIRDGYGELGRNQEVFQYTVDVLRSNLPLCVLPEGNHEGQKRLRQLKKGIFRIAFQAEESTSTPLNLNIVPVGIDYSDYFNAGSDLTIVFGTPIIVPDYLAGFHENEARTINTLMDLLAENMRNVMIHIPEEHYQLIYTLSEMYEPNVWNTRNTNRHPYNKLTIKQYIVQKLTESFAKKPGNVDLIEKALNTYQEEINKLGYIDSELQQKPQGFVPLLAEVLLSILAAPVHLYGLVLNYIPYKTTDLASAKIRDKHFKSSVQFGIGILLLPVYYLIVITLFCFLTDDLLLKAGFGLSLPISGMFAFYNFKHLKKLVQKVRLFFFRITKGDQYKSLIEERNQLINLIKTTINN